MEITKQMELVLYHSEQSDVTVNAIIKDETIWITQKAINAFLEFRRYDILRDNGKVSHKQALEKAYHEYEIFNKTQPIESDFDKVVKEIENKR